MKVFTVGLDEKPPLKEHPEPEGVTVVPPPMIAVEKKVKKNYKGYMLCFATMFFVLFFSIILSEIAYNRARDESFLRLRWAELRHRMGMGCSECNHNRISQSLFRQSRLDGAPAIEGMREVSPPKITTPSLPLVQPIDDTPKETKSMDPRLEFLRQILSKIREQAEKAGIDGTMRVSVIRIDPMEEAQDNSVLDSFGEPPQQPQFGNPFEYQANKQTNKMFGPWPMDDYYSNEESSPQVIEVLANRRTEMGPQMGSQGMEIFPMAQNVMDSTNGWSNSILPWAGTVNQGQKTFETFQPIQQPDFAQPQQQQWQQWQQWPANNFQPQEQWQSFQQPQSTPIVQNNQWYQQPAQNQNPLWQWSAAQNQWQPVSNAWNQWQNGIQANNNQQPQQTAFQWPAQQQVPNVMPEDNRWQASLQNNEWNVQRANTVDNNQIIQSAPAPAQWWNNDIVQQPQQETQNVVPVVQQQPSTPILNQQINLPWTHEAQKPFVGGAAQTEQRVIVASVENNDKPVVPEEEHITIPDEQTIPIIPQEQIVEVIEQPSPKESEVVPVVQQKPEVEEPKEIVVPQIPRLEATLKSETPEKMEEEPVLNHIHDLPELELAYQNQHALPLADSDLSEEQQPKIDFPAIKFPVEPLNEGGDDPNSHLFFQVDEPQPQFNDAEAFVA